MSDDPPTTPAPTPGKKKSPSKRERFEGLWQARLEKTSASIRRLGNLSTSAYDWQPNEITEGLRRLSREISDVSDRFRRSRRWPKK